MRMKSPILTVALLGGIAVAQAAPASQAVTPATHGKAQAVTSAPKVAKSPFSPKPMNASAATKAHVKATASAKTPVQPAAKTATALDAGANVPSNSAVAAAAPTKFNPGKRDPFLSPIVSTKGPATTCTTGKRCLVVDQIVLKGIVQMKNGNFALVENAAKRPYVLHENDSLFNGSVVKISADSVIFREESSDMLGRPVSHEVVKKVSAPAV